MDYITSSSLSVSPMLTQAAPVVASQSLKLDRTSRRFDSAEDAEHAFNIERLPDAVRRLFAQPRFEQGTSEWMAARHNFVTASIAAAPLGYYPYQSRVNLFTEKTMPHPPAPFTNADMQRGKDNEDVAVLLYEQLTGRIALDFGMLLHWRLYEDLRPAPCIDAKSWFNTLRSPFRPAWMDAAWWQQIEQLNWFAGSPDGVTLDGRLLEIKCPRQISRTVKDYYNAQIQLNMEVMDLEWCDFFEYQVSTGEYWMTSVPRDRAWFAQWSASVRPFWLDVLECRRTQIVPPEYTPRPSKKRLLPNAVFDQ